MKNIDFKILAVSFLDVAKFLVLWSLGLGILFTIAKYMTLSFAMLLIASLCVCFLTYMEYNRRIDKKLSEARGKNFLGE